MGDPRAKRALRLLSFSFGIAWIAIAMVVAPGSAAWVELSGDASHAGFFIATFALSTAAGAAVAGRAMDKWGRRPVLFAAHALAGVGFAGAGVSYATGSLYGFAVATAVLASAIGVIYLTRVAAAEMFAASERARAVARVQVTATVGAVMGPLLLLAAGPLGALVDRSATGIVWFFAPPLFLASAILVLASPEPLVLARHVAASNMTPGAMATRRAPPLALRTGIAALVCAQAGMIAVMGVTGVALHDAGHTATTTSAVMAAHFLGMFGLSPLVGKFADRLGRKLTIISGTAILASGGLSVAVVPGAPGLVVGLLLVGIGWSFAYIGGTVILSDVVPVAKRARTVGLTDFGTAIFAAAASFGAGWWYATRGLPALGFFAIALVLLPAVLALMLREKRPGTYRAWRAKDDTLDATAS